MSDGVLMGLGAIAQFCLVTRSRVKSWMMENPDFPARREGANGAWLTTNRALLRWLDGYVSKGEPGGFKAAFEEETQLALERRRPKRRTRRETGT